MAGIDLKEDRHMDLVDLHVHSTKSDGTLTPAGLVDYARGKKLRAFALTDHDTVDGLREAIEYAESLRQREAADRAESRCPVPEVIPGIEFSTEYWHRDIHIVGLYIDYEKSGFRERLQYFIDSRHTRNRKMCALLQEGGFDVTYEALQEAFPNSIITRPHYARYMMQKGYVSSLKEAFDRYLGEGRPYYIPREKVTPAQAIRLILEADGVPVLAHPILYRMSDARLEALVAELKEAGLMGIEAIYSTYSAAEERQIRGLARKYRLLISGGSDFHGSNKPGLDLGCGYGKLKVPGAVLDDIKRSRKNALFADLDGTLLRSDSHLGAPMKKALLDMTGAGHRLILTSGRPLPAILDVCETDGLTFPGLLIIANNGALIYDPDSGRALREERLSQEDVACFTARAREAGIHIHGYTRSHIVATEMDAELRKYTERIHMPVLYAEDIAAALPDGCFKLQVIHLTDHEALVRFRDSLLPLCGDRVHMVFSNDSYLEILPAQADKGKALRFIESWLPIPHSHTFAAGDAQNDISMLQAAGLGIAMQGADDAVRAQADLVTARSNDEDGLLEVLERYFR